MVTSHVTGGKLGCVMHFHFTVRTLQERPAPISAGVMKPGIEQINISKKSHLFIRPLL